MQHVGFSTLTLTAIKLNFCALPHPKQNWGKKKKLHLILRDRIRNSSTQLMKYYYCFR